MTTSNPRYALLMHLDQKQTSWCELDPDEWKFCEEDPKRYKIFVITGREVTVLIATENFEATYQEALKTASSFVFGRWEKIVVDLKNLTGHIEHGKPIVNPHPPY